MDRLLQILQAFKQVAIQHPYLTGTAAVFSLAVLILRRIHQRFVVYPDVGGRHNSENVQGYRHPSEKGLKSEDIQIVSEKGLILRGWYIKHNNPQALMIYYHENAGNIGGRLYYIRQLQKRLNYNVLIVAYRGFSDSDGDKPPHQDSLMKDAQAIMDKAIELSNRDKLPLVVFGRSLGGAASINVLSQPGYKNAAQALILQNTFTSIYDVVANFTPTPFKWLLPILWLITSNSYNSKAKLSNVHIPILFIKGCKDLLIPKKQMDQLHQIYIDFKRQHSQLQVREGTHNDTWMMAGEEYFEVIGQFIQQNCQQ